MYICDNCGQVIENLNTHQESRPFGSTVGYETITDWECHCGGVYEKADHRCKKCGEWMANVDAEHGICPDCVDRLTSEISHLLSENFTESELECFFDNDDAVWQTIDNAKGE